MMMERTRPKIELYKTRSFSEKLNATFDFCTENWKALLKWNTYLVLPLCFIVGFFLNGYFNDLSSILALRGAKSVALVNSALSFVLNAGGWILSVILLSLVSVGLLYALLRLYNEREEGLDNLTFEELRPVLLRNIGRIILLSLLLLLLLTVLYGAVIAILIGMYAIHEWLCVLMVLLTIMWSFVLFIALSLTGPACLLDDEESVISSMLKGLRLGIKTFGGVFSVGLMCTMISWVVSSVAMVPYYGTMFPLMLKMRETGGSVFVPSGMDVLWAALLIVFMFFVNYLSHIVPMLGMGYQYGHAAAKYAARETERVIEEDYEEL